MMFHRGLHIPASGQIDWSNPITNRLTALFVCSGAGARDLVTGRFHAATGGSHAVGALGPAWLSGGPGSYIQCGSYSNTLPYSVIIACNVVQGVDAISPVGLTDLAGDAGWSLRTVQWQNITELGLTHLAGGGDNLANPNLSMVGWYGQDEHVLSVAVDGQNVRYARGKAARSTGMTAGFNGGTHTFSIGKEGTGGDTNRSAVPSGSLFYWVAYYNRQLSFSELDFWHNNAGAIVVPRRIPSVALRSRRYEAINRIGPVSITSNNDDGQVQPPNWHINGESGGFANWAGWYASNPYRAAFRFVLPNAIPAGATIVSAKLRLYLMEYWSWTTATNYLQIRAIKSANAPQLSSDPTQGYNEFNASTLTTATARWPASGGLDIGPINNFKDTIDFAPVIQELVDTYGGLAAGAGVHLVIANWAGLPDDSELGFSDYSRNSASERASLKIEYSNGRAPKFFGDQTFGVDQFPLSNDRCLVDRFTLPEAGTVVRGYAFNNAGTGDQWKFVVLADNAGVPSTVLAVSSAVSIDAAKKWFEFPINVNLSAGDYWLGVVSNNFNCSISEDIGGSAPNMVMANGTFSFATPPGTWPGTDANYDVVLNVFAEYTVNGVSHLTRKFSSFDPVWLRLHNQR